MSDLVFPTVRGLTWSAKKSPKFATVEQVSSSLKRVTAMLAADPVWDIELNYDYLKDDTSRTGSNTYSDLRTILGFFLQMRGRFDTFLWQDPDDMTVANQVIGTGNGTQTKFQLVRDFGGFSEMIQNPDAGTQVIKVNGVTVTPSSTVNGLVTLASAPTSGQSVTWSGNFYFRCQFVEDTQEFEQVMSKLWSTGSLALRSVKL